MKRASALTGEALIELPSPGSAISAEALIEVPFHDVDAMEVAWHGHYIKYFEAARNALLRSIGYDYREMRESGYLWPVVECHAKYIRPARYGQKLKARAELLEYENRMKTGYVIQDAGSGEVLTRGHTVQVAVAAASGELQFVSPQALIERVERFQRKAAA
jgi:acyl-CoA thioester hydrolase